MLNIRLKELRKVLGLKQNEFGISLGVSRDVISNYELGRVELKEHFIKSICSIHNVNEAWLRTGQGEMFNPSDSSIINRLVNEYKLDDLDKKIVEAYIKLPVEERNNVKRYALALLSATENNIIPLKQTAIIDDEQEDWAYQTSLYGDICAGDGIEPIEDREVIKCPVECDFALTVRGDSMEPRFHDGEVIYLRNQNVLDNGEIGAIQVYDDIIPIVYLKKFYNEDGRIRLVSLNKVYEDKILSPEDVTVIGRVIQ